MGNQQFPAAVDYSVARPAPLSIKMAGYTGVMRYLGVDNRCIGWGERNALLSAGLGIGFVYETSANRTLSGLSAGKSDAHMANGYADLLGIPKTHPLVIVTIDFQASDAQIRGPIADYAHGAITESERPVRPYGHYRALEILCGELGLYPCGWQCAAWSGTGSGSGGYGVDVNGQHRPLSKYACLYQSVGYVLNNTSDHNSLHMDKTELLWHPNWDKPADKPTNQPDVKEDDDMVYLVQDDRPNASPGIALLDGFKKLPVLDPVDVDFYRNDPGIVNATLDNPTTTAMRDRVLRRYDQAQWV